LAQEQLLERLVQLIFPYMLQVTVAVPSGRSEIFSIAQSSKVGDLRVLAQKSFQLGFLRLVAADHSVVDPTKSLQAAGLEDGAHLTAIAIEAKVAATSNKFKQLGLHTRSWRMGLLWSGAIHIEVVTALKSRTSSKVSSIFKQLTLHSLQSFWMGLLWSGAIQI